MTALAALDLASLIASVLPAAVVDNDTGLPGRVVSYAVGRAESGGDPHILITDSNGLPSTGIWQENGADSPSLQDDPAAQARVMAQHSQGGTNWHPWSTFSYTADLHYVGPGSPRAAFAAYIQEAQSTFALLAPATPPPASEVAQGYYVQTAQGPIFIDAGATPEQIAALVALYGGPAPSASSSSGSGTIALLAAAGLVVGAALWRR